MTASTLGLDAAQFAHAQTIIDTVRSENLPARAAIICLETAIVESRITIDANPDVPTSESVPHEGEGSDHASVGIYQQQVPSWGTAADCMDPAKSTLKFLHGGGSNPGLTNLPGYRFEFVGYPNAANWQRIPTGDAAQAVQVSEYPDRYQQQEGWATQIVYALWEDEMSAAAEAQIAYVYSQLRAAIPHGQTGFGPAFANLVSMLQGDHNIDQATRSQVQAVMAELQKQGAAS